MLYIEDCSRMFDHRQSAVQLHFFKTVIENKETKDK